MVNVSTSSDGIRISTDGDAWAARLPEIDLESIFAIDQTITVGGDAGQIFQSQDGGNTWSTLNPERLWLSDDDANSVAMTTLGLVYIEEDFPSTIVAPGQRLDRSRSTFARKNQGG